MTQLIRFYSNLILSLGKVLNLIQFNTYFYFLSLYLVMRPNVQTLTNKTEDSKKAESSNNRIERL